MECKNCGAPLEEEAALCPNCGAEQPREPEAVAVEMPTAEAASEPIEEQVAEAAPKAPGRKLFLSLWYGITGQWLLHKNDVLYKTNYTVSDEQLLKAADKVKGFVSVELSMGQMIEDVRLATACKKPVGLCNRCGGMIPSPDEVLESIRNAQKGVF